jgi:hypothetical protein
MDASKGIITKYKIIKIVMVGINEKGIPCFVLDRRD